MNAIAMTFATALASVAAAAAIGVGLANGTAEAAGVMPERTLAAAPRAEVLVVARLPRVVVEHRRTAVAAAPAQVRPS